MSLGVSVSGPKKPKSLFGYDIIDTIGEGAGSFLYVATDPKTHQLCTIKHVVVKSDADERFLDQLMNEYEVGSKVNHKGLRHAMEVKTNKSFLQKAKEAVLVMEFVDGIPLAHQRPDTIAGDADCFLQTAQALRALHAAGYVHCDLKPDNILLCSDGQVKVIDLGQAAKIGTKKERIQGSVDYISPEQVNKEALSTRTDVFNLGATMYAVLSGGKKLPTLFSVKQKGGANSFLLEGHIPSPREANPQIPENLSNLVMECIRIDVKNRPEMGEVIKRLEVIHYGLSKQH